MRRTLRLLASVKPTARYLEAGNPTGLTGLFTHPTPRSTLLYLYDTTLDKLKAVPEHSLYRQSVEALTKHRLAVVEAAVPPGYDAWVAKTRQLAAEHPERVDTVDGAWAARVEHGGATFVIRKPVKKQDQRYEEWDGEIDEGPELEGPRTEEERKDQAVMAERRPLEEAQRQVEWEPEPQLTADQISELETKIGAGLIEEVIQVAEGELKLVDTMIKAKAWESLEEQPTEGQWVYFERKA